MQFSMVDVQTVVRHRERERREIERTNALLREARGARSRGKQLGFIERLFRGRAESGASIGAFKQRSSEA